MLDFKSLYDTGATLTDVLPGLVKEYPERYAELTLRQLCDEMHAQLRSSELIPLPGRGFHASAHTPRF
ncbi:hypothetical protein [Kutzneria kofuensis]|uniref:Orn/Lys/Arg family decarboxylase n=1 Tax=Kutzneria kofuensis TaxID=103725 RepID=UPI003CD079E6